MPNLRLLIVTARTALFGVALAGCSDGTGAMSGESTAHPTASSGAATTSALPSTSPSVSVAPSASSNTVPPLPQSCSPGDASDFEPPVATPLISLGKPATASGGLDASGLVDGAYHSNSSVTFGVPPEDEPVWAAIDVGAGPSELLVGFIDNSTNEYNVATFTPRAYELQTSSDSTDGSDGDWETVTEISDNSVRSRAHAIPFSGQRWVRMLIHEAQEGSTKGVVLDEITIYDLSDVPAGQSDTWFFFGDSITKAAFQRDAAKAKQFDKAAAALDATRTPAYINGGIGGETTVDALARLDEMLEVHKDIRHFGIAFGTNDSWDGQFSTTKFEANLTQIIDRVLEAGHVPVLARIPYASEHHTNLPDYELVIDGLQAKYHLPCGPDLYTWFAEHPTELSAADGVHPTTTGSGSINQRWAEAAIEF